MKSSKADLKKNSESQGVFALVLINPPLFSHINNRNGDFLFSLTFPEIKVKTYFILSRFFLDLIFYPDILLILELQNQSLKKARMLLQ